MESIWQASETLPAFPALEKDIETDVLVIGGGLTGLLCAHRLQEQGRNCVVVEADTLMSGTSGHTTAKLTSQHGLIYTKLVRRFGKHPAALYYQANQKAIEEYRKLAETCPCDFEEQDAFVYSCGELSAVRREYLLTKLIGGRAEMVRELPLPLPVMGAVRLPEQAQFHPVKLAAGLVKDLTVYEHTQVSRICGTTAETTRGNIRAKNVIVASHFPFIDRHGLYFMKLYQQRSYVLGLEIGESLPGMYLDALEGGLSFRMAGDMLLLGGAGHRTGKRGGGFPRLEEAAARLYPDARIAYRWAAQDCMTLDDLPYIGPYSPAMENVYVATGFGKWGMSSAMVSAMILTDLIQGKENPYAALFDPHRSILRKQLFFNLLETGAHILRPTVPRCTHLGCALNWNKAEHSWDCPCHGSRFGEDGAVLENPALKHIKTL